MCYSLDIDSRIHLNYPSFLTYLQLANFSITLQMIPEGGNSTKGKQVNYHPSSIGFEQFRKYEETI